MRRERLNAGLLEWLLTEHFELLKECDRLLAWNNAAEDRISDLETWASGLDERAVAVGQALDSCASTLKEQATDARLLIYRKSEADEVSVRRSWRGE